MSNNLKTELVSYVVKGDSTVRFDYMTEQEYKNMKDRGLTEVGVSDFAKSLGNSED